MSNTVNYETDQLAEKIFALKKQYPDNGHIRTVFKIDMNSDYLDKLKEQAHQDYARSLTIRDESPQHLFKGSVITIIESVDSFKVTTDV